MRGLSRGEFSIELGQRSTESKLKLFEVMKVGKGQHHPILHLGGGLSSCRTQRLLRISLEEELRLCFI